MLLSDVDILNRGPEVVEPFDREMVQPSSVDLRLDNKFLIPEYSPWIIADPAKENDFLHPVEVEEGDSYILGPQQFALGSTYEKVSIPTDLAGRFEGKSSLGRLGLFTHITAGFIDPGFEGYITMEFFNALMVPIRLHPGMKIGQLCLFEMKRPPMNPYGSVRAGSHYQGQRGPTASRSYDKFYRKNVHY